MTELSEDKPKVLKKKGTGITSYFTKKGDPSLATNAEPEVPEVKIEYDQEDNANSEPIEIDIEDHVESTPPLVPVPLDVEPPKSPPKKKKSKPKADAKRKVKAEVNDEDEHGNIRGFIDDAAEEEKPRKKSKNYGGDETDEEERFDRGELWYCKPQIYLKDGSVKEITASYAGPMLTYAELMMRVRTKCEKHCPKDQILDIALPPPEYQSL